MSCLSLRDFYDKMLKKIGQITLVNLQWKTMSHQPPSQDVAICRCFDNSKDFIGENRPVHIVYVTNTKMLHHLECFGFTFHFDFFFFIEFFYNLVFNFQI